MRPSSNDGVQVRRLESKDISAFLDLVDALADYEHLTRPEPAARERLTRDALANPPRFSVYLAERGGRVVGYAVFFETYSTFLALPTLYLEDLFVLPEERGRGAGLALFRACAEEAIRRGCGRMEWQVLTWNEPAIGFYEKLGAARLDEWHSYRLDAEGLQRVGGRPGAVSSF